MLFSSHRSTPPCLPHLSRTRPSGLRSLVSSSSEGVPISFLFVCISPTPTWPSASRRWLFTWHDHCLVLRRATSASWSGVGVPLPPSLCRWLADLASPRVGARSLVRGALLAPRHSRSLGRCPTPGPWVGAPLPVLGSVPMWRVSTLTSPSRRLQTSPCAFSRASLSRASSGPSWHPCAERGSHMPTLSS